MLLIAEGIRSGLTVDQINYLVQHKHSLTEMKIILGAFEHGVTEDDFMQIYRKIKNPD